MSETAPLIEEGVKAAKAGTETKKSWRKLAILSVALACCGAAATALHLASPKDKVVMELKNPHGRPSSWELGLEAAVLYCGWFDDQPDYEVDAADEVCCHLANKKDTCSRACWEGDAKKNGLACVPCKYDGFWDSLVEGYCFSGWDQIGCSDSWLTNDCNYIHGKCKGHTRRLQDEPAPARKLSDLPALVDEGDDPYCGRGACSLENCHGDCDSDSICGPWSVCYERGGRTAGSYVPGCRDTTGLLHSKPDHDFCIDSKLLQDVAPGTDPPDHPLGLCQGDCDNDDECEGDLICYQRENGADVPGCKDPGNQPDEYDGADYCVEKKYRPLPICED